MNSDSVNTLNAIRRLALKDLDAASDDDLLAEIVADGADPEALARSVAMELDATIAAFMRDRLMAAKARASAALTAPKRRPALARIKELIDDAFRLDASLATAFREGNRQSEADLQSLYDDLVDLGKIEPEGDD
jgi:hypothetical protein